MTFLSELATRSLENPAVPLSDLSLVELFGGPATTSGVHMTPEKSMRLAVLFRGVQILGSSCGASRLRVYRQNDQSEVFTSVLTRDKSATPMERWETVVSHMALWGAGILWKNRDSAGNIRSLTTIHPYRVVVDAVKTNDPAKPYERRFTIDGKAGYTEYEVLYIPFLSLDGVRGLGPVSYCRETFGTATAAEQVAAKMFSQGLLLDGILTTDKPVSQKMAARLKRRWKAMTQGIENAHDIAVLDNGAKFQPISQLGKDAQFLEQRAFSRSEIAGLIGLPGWMLNDQEKSTSWGTGMEQQFNTFVKITLRAYLERIEQRLNAEILPGTQYSEFDMESLLRGDSAARASYYASGITHGWLVPNDIRPRENLQPVPWGDEPYLPHNASADSGQQQAPKEGQ